MLDARDFIAAHVQAEAAVRTAWLDIAVKQH